MCRNLAYVLLTSGIQVRTPTRTESPKQRVTAMSKVELIIVERYKHIVAQQAKLDLASVEALNLYIKGGTVLLAAFAAVIGAQDTLKLSPDQTSGLLQLVSWAMWFLGSYVVVTILANMASWWDYRTEETELAMAHVALYFRKPPKLNLLRWRETWMVVFIIGSLLLVQCVAVPYANHLIPAVADLPPETVLYSVRQCTL